ncbi:hypothetical protein [Streptomyces coelicoflavus]
MELSQRPAEPGRGGGRRSSGLVVHNHELGKLGNMAYNLRERLGGR